MYYVHAKDAEPSEGQSCVDHPSAVALLKLDPSKLKITFVPTEDQLQEWRDRERGRFDRGEYQPVPWAETLTNLYQLHDHFCHLSRSQPGMIAYTKSPEHGIADRQTRVRPGKYLQEFYADDYSADRISSWIAECTSIVEGLKIARTAEEIELIYRHGPESCMSHDLRHYRSHVHPVHVYGDSDLALAYYGTPDRPSARAIIWPDKMRHSRVYGGDGVLERLLTNAGYRPGSLDGAKVRAIPCDRGGYVMPYIDYIDSADLRGQWFVLGEGDYDAQVTNGVTDGRDPDMAECDNCGNVYHADDEGGNGYCQSCYDDRYRSCADCSEVYRHDRMNYVDNIGDLCESCYQDRHTTCAIDGCETEWIELELDRAERRTRADNHTTDLCPSCATTHRWCQDCEEHYQIPTKTPARLEYAVLAGSEYLPMRSCGITPADLATPDPVYSPHCSTCDRPVADVLTLPLLPDPLIVSRWSCDCADCQRERNSLVPLSPILIPANPSLFSEVSL